MLHKNFTRFSSILCLVVTICVGMVTCGSKKTVEFTMRSNDTVGAVTHTLVGGEYEPSGTYEVVCVKGHGALTVNDANLQMLAADDSLGKEYSGLTYMGSAVLELNANDILSARAFNSTEFKLEFKYSGS